MLPNFIIAGVEKTGSTSLYNYLSQHPDIFLPDHKEPEFFLNKDFPNDLEYYESLFTDVSSETAVGEASVSYFHNPHAGVRIKEMIPDVRLIVVLRDPAERAYSHYNMLVEHNAIPCRPFIDALSEAHRSKNYQNTGIPTSRYADSLEHYLSLFGDNMKVYTYSYYANNTLDMIKSIFKHINVDNSFTPDLSSRHNITHLPKSAFINRLVWSNNIIKSTAKILFPKGLVKRARGVILKSNRSPVPPLSTEARRLLIDILEDDINRTEELLGLDLSAWKR